MKDYLKIERATDLSRGEVGRLGSAILFIVVVMIYTGASFSAIEQLHLLVAAAVVGAYMAMNVGVNDEANNVGPAVGAFTLTLASVFLIAAAFGAGGAVFAGGDVVSAVKKGVVDPVDVADPNVFVWVMMGALIGAFERKVLRKALKRQRVNGSSLLKVVSARIGTVPVSAFLAAPFYFVRRGILLL